MKKLLVFLVIFLNFGCARYGDVEVREAVMEDGMKICAMTKDGSICIEAEGNRYRHITWDGITRTSKMISRKERWLGMLGVMNSGYERLNFHSGITRVNYLESQLHFSSETEAANDFKHGGFDENNYVYSHDGVAVYFEKVVFPDMAPGGVLQLYVYQYLINGQKPKSLPGSQDEMISVERAPKPLRGTGTSNE